MDSAINSPITTYLGITIDPWRPRIDQIQIVDIAHALSGICRWGGHCQTFYSVAQHSLIVSSLLPQRLALWGLLHDAAEAYLADIPRPVKTRMPEFVHAERRLLRVIAKRFGLVWPIPPEVFEADDRVLAHEAQYLMRVPPVSAPDGIDLMGPQPFKERDRPTVKLDFLMQFAFLTGTPPCI